MKNKYEICSEAYHWSYWSHWMRRARFWKSFQNGTCRFEQAQCVRWAKMARASALEVRETNANTDAFHSAVFYNWA